MGYIINIRKMQQSDCHNLTALAIQVWLNTYATDGIRDKISTFVLKTFTPEYFSSIYQSQDRELYIAIIKDHLVGFVTIDHKSTCPVAEYTGHEISTLYVQDHFQKKGIGSQLLQEQVNRDGTGIWLTTWIQNHPAISFYKNFGLTSIGSTMFDLDGEKHENIVLALRE